MRDPSLRHKAGSGQRASTTDDAGHVSQQCDATSETAPRSGHAHPLLSGSLLVSIILCPPPTLTSSVAACVRHSSPLCLLVAVTLSSVHSSPSLSLRFARSSLAAPAHPSTAAMDLDEHLMNFVNFLGMGIFVAIALFHYAQSAAKQQ